MGDLTAIRSQLPQAKALYLELHPETARGAKNQHTAASRHNGEEHDRFTAKRRLADEYDAAQKRGEVASGRPRKSSAPEDFQATISDIGLSSKDIYEARIVRDAEQASPGIVRASLDAYASFLSAPLVLRGLRSRNFVPGPLVMRGLVHARLPSGPIVLGGLVITSLAPSPLVVRGSARRAVKASG